MTEQKQMSWKRLLLQAIIIFLFGGFFNLLVWGGDIFRADFNQLTISFSVNGTFWVMLSMGSQYIVWILDKFFPWVDFPIKRLIVSVVSVIIYTTMVVILLDILIDVFIVGKSFVQAIQKINQTSLTITIFITLGINAFMHGRGFLLAWRQASIDIEKLKTEQAFTQFQSLKNQVNPHFLFNSLNALSSLVYEDQDKAVEFIRKLSKVYRFVLERKDEEVIPIEQEVDFLSDFVFLQKIRFGDNLSFVLEEETKEGYLPPMALQLLVENAIKHNIISEDRPLSIDVIIGSEFCSVKNNLQEKLSKDSTGIGLSNLKERYSYLSNREIVISNKDGFFEVQIPTLKFKNEVHNN